MQLVMNPQQFDVMVMENLYGDERFIEKKLASFALFTL
jgi:hypothetical protein